MIFFKQKTKRGNFGFSLLELILAIAIFSLGSFAIATMLIDSNISTRFDTERIEALSYAKESIEAVRSIRDASSTAWSDLADGDYGLDDSSGIWVSSSTPDVIDGKYTRTISIVSTTSSSTKTVSVAVSWDLTPARPVSVVLNTLFTNWISVVNTATSSDSQIPTDGLVSYWSFDDAGEGTAIDSVGTSTGTVYGATSTTGVSGDADTAYSFNGVSDYINIGNMGTFPPQGTLSSWIKYEGTDTTDNFFQTDGGNQGIRFERTSDVRTAVVIQYSSGADVHDYATTTMANSYWYLVTLVWDGTSNNVKGYVNDILQFDDNQYNWPTTLPVVNIGVGYSQSRYWTGGIDNVRIYNRALTPDEITTIYEEEGT